LVEAYDTQSQETTQGTFYLGADINGNIISGSAYNNIGGSGNDAVYTTSGLFTTLSGNKWPAVNETIYYYDGPLAGNAFTPSTESWFSVFTAEIPSTDMTTNPFYFNKIRVFTDGTITNTDTIIS